MVDCWCSSLLSLHCWEPGVFAALLSQPHAVPSCLGAKKPGHTPKCPHKPGHTPKSHGLTPNLEREGQQIASTSQPSEAQTLFHHINTTTWVTSKRYPTRQTSFNTNQLPRSFVDYQFFGKAKATVKKKCVYAKK
ncbi:hypothetical protein CR513_43771, partial [Mucuna pruriens]